MATDILALSSEIIDSGDDRGQQTNRVTLEVAEVADGVAVVEAFSHVWALTGGDGLVLFDTSLAVFGEQARAALRTWRDDPVATIVYTHGHVDHVGGTGAFLEEADSTGRPRPAVVAHANVGARFDRYDQTNGYNTVINARQFGGTGLGRGGFAFPREWHRPSVTFTDRLTLDAGGLAVELRHARGETDDHAWAWVPEHRAVLAGDFVTWVFPNAGNPQKVQRYPSEWAAALREMQGLEPDLLLGAHGLPVGGHDRVHRVLGDLAGALEFLVAETVGRMNAGEPLDAILAEVRLDDEALARPWMRPVYDEPEFVVRNIWRQYGGWYDGNPARLKPPTDAALATEIAGLVGSSRVLAARAEELADAGEFRVACQLVEWAVQAEPDDAEAHAARADVYAARRRAESSLMAQGIYGAAARSSAPADESSTEH